MADRDVIHAGACGPSRGGFRVCYCEAACCRRDGRCVCSGCRATNTCSGNQKEPDVIDTLLCPVADCGEETYGGDDLRDHLQDEHEPHEVRQAAVALVKAVASAKAHTECEACGCFGATPGDHPLCDDCEEKIHG